MDKSLFNEFRVVSAKEWKQQIQVELKGADFNEKLVTKTENGIDIKPFYHADDVDEYSSISTEDWKICQSFEVNNATNKDHIIEAVHRGAEQIQLLVNSKAASISEIVEALNEKKIKPYVIYQTVHFNELQKTLQELAGKAIFIVDPIAKLGSTGNWFANQKTDFKFLKEVATKNDLVLTLQLNHYQNAGATHVQQLAYAMAHLNEYLNISEHEGYLQKIKAIHMQISLGSNYFFEIAKLRTLRVLIESLIKAYNLDVPINIIAEPSLRNKTLYDYNVNMLRTTTECMSAILGGADVICNQNYDYIYKNENEFANRISRNQLLILKNESYFDKVHNPADGSYYIESLTNQLQDKALSIFQDIEQGGGLIKQLFEGKIQKKIKESDAKEREEFASAQKKLVGTNAYANKDEKLDTHFDKNPFMATQSKKTLMEPILVKRLAEDIEKRRLAESDEA